MHSWRHVPARRCESYLRAIDGGSPSDDSFGCWAPRWPVWPYAKRMASITLRFVLTCRCTTCSCSGRKEEVETLCALQAYWSVHSIVQWAGCHSLLHDNLFAWYQIRDVWIVLLESWKRIVIILWRRYPPQPIISLFRRYSPSFRLLIEVDCRHRVHTRAVRYH